MREKLDALRARTLSNPVIIALAVMFLLRPPGLAGLSLALSWTMAAGRIVVALGVAVFFLARPKLSAATVTIGVYYVIVLASTLINHGDRGIYGTLNEDVCIAVVCVLVDMAADTDPKAFVRGMAGGLGIMCVANLVTVILSKSGIGYYAHTWEYYLMGLDNSHSFFIIPLLPAALLCAGERRWPMWVQAALLALFTASVYITWSASGVVAVSVFILLFLLWKLKGSWRVCNIGMYYAAIAAIFLLVVVLQTTGWFSFLIRNVLHKDLTLSKRTPIWTAAIAYIRERPLLGGGELAYETARALLGGINCHNLYLQVPFDTGIVGSVVYLTLLGLVVKPLMRVRKSFGGYMLAAGLFAYLLVLEVESLVWPMPFYMLFILCYHAEKVVPALEPEPD